MNNYIKNKIKDRLTYCQEWKGSIDIYLTNREITKKTDKGINRTEEIL